MNYQLLLRELCSENAPSGLEFKLHPIMEKNFGYIKDLEISKDENYNLYINKKGKRNGTIMIMAHSDEISLVITEVIEGGFLRFKAIGMDANILLGQEVAIHGCEVINGVIGGIPKSKTDDNILKKAVVTSDLFIDTGYPKEYLEEVIKIGDRATLIGEYKNLLRNTISSKAIDDRAGILSMLICAQELKEHELDVVFVCSCQEELGHRGAKMASYKVKPNLAIAIDVTFDNGEFGDRDRENKLGNGPIICIGPNNHPRMIKKLKEVARKYYIPFGVEVEPGNTGSDAWDIQVSRGGIPTVLVSIPIKYMHTSVETANLGDIKNTGRLVARFIEEIKLLDLEELTCF
ncbi:M20/M25/M40 family metallo-hydrolase [Clostridium cellulovorans]|uniref:Peptidase M42 family protein n=2 Tax=Clostridium cellulovorans TaxID=1493 RepID=D9SMS3_CLOC7|nr:M20/M25/M40 family metallo-hydrolase [Clostridium cellulovorans]ADL49858.1 peptidase M42 family protein [Clostridium cellulovorans 743B]